MLVMDSRASKQIVSPAESGLFIYKEATICTVSVCLGFLTRLQFSNGQLLDPPLVLLYQFTF
jgi:hypothetical protein